MKYYIIGGLIALAVFACSWISEPKIDPRELRTQEILAEQARKMDEEGEKAFVIGHKTTHVTNWLEFKSLKPLPTNLVMETCGEFFRVVDPKSPLGHWVIVGGGSQYPTANAALKAYWEMHEYLEEKKSKTWHPVVVPSDMKTNEIYVGSSTVYVLNVSNLTKDYTNLFQLQIDGVPIVTVKPNGDVIYDTNNVSEATRIFWREMTYQARKVTERIGK